MWLQLCPMKIHEKKSTGISDTKKEQQQQKNDATSGKEKENLIKLCSPSHLAPTMADQTVQFGRDRRLSTRPISGTAERETKMQWKKNKKKERRKDWTPDEGHGWGSRTRNRRIDGGRQSGASRRPSWPPQMAGIKSSVQFNSWPCSFRTGVGVSSCLSFNSPSPNTSTQKKKARIMARLTVRLD